MKTSVLKLDGLMSNLQVNENHWFVNTPLVSWCIYLYVCLLVCLFVHVCVCVYLSVCLSMHTCVELDYVNTCAIGCVTFLHEGYHGNSDMDLIWVLEW